MPHADSLLSIVKRIVSDLSKNTDNYIIFDNLLLALISLEVDLEFAQSTLLAYYTVIFKLISEYPTADHKVSVMPLLTLLL